ncbi:MAG: FAD-linked oxidase C-terminal domain-containing protein [Pseudomonadota bacterium]
MHNTAPTNDAPTQSAKPSEGISAVGTATSADAGGSTHERRAAGLAVLKQRFGEQVSTGASVRQQHAHSTSWLANEPADAVVFATTEQDVIDTLGIARAYQLPIIPFGAGTSLEGQVNAPDGGICIDLSALNEIKAVNDLDLDCVVGPGVTRKRLNDHLRDRGLFFPVDPGADYASLGGMASTRASGTTAVRYGTMRDNVLSLRAVLANGDVVTTARRARKTSAGYDLTHLLVGAEGTLGIITELTLRLYGIPETTAAAACPFDSIEGACNTVIQAIQLGLGGIARIEFLDALQVRACNEYSKLTLSETPTLFIEVHGTPASARDTIAQFKELALGEGAFSFDWAEATEDRNRLWQARHDAYWAARALQPTANAVATDVCVPISRLAECVTETHADIAAHGLQCPIVGHVGDGNFHALPLVNMDDPADVARTEAFLERLVERALEMGGTCTGEHGIGQGKRKYLRREHGDGAVDMMRTVKTALDPDNLLNPGKIF